MKHNRSKNAMLLMIIFICSICSNNVWARETGAMDQLEKENLDDVDKMNKVLYSLRNTYPNQLKKEFSLYGTQADKNYNRIEFLVT